MGDHVEGRSPKMLKSLNEVGYVAHVKVHVLSSNMVLISSPQHVPRPSYPFWAKIRRSGKGSFTKKAKIVDRVSGSLCSALESTGSQLHYDPYLISVACS